MGFAKIIAVSLLLACCHFLPHGVLGTALGRIDNAELSATGDVLPEWYQNLAPQNRTRRQGCPSCYCTYSPSLNSCFEACRCGRTCSSWQCQQFASDDDDDDDDDDDVYCRSCAYARGSSCYNCASGKYKYGTNTATSCSNQGNSKFHKKFVSVLSPTPSAHNDPYDLTWCRGVARVRF